MKIYSLTQHNFETEVFEIEVSLMSGLPQILILGQADSLVKESIPKIQSAIKSQGFRLPKAQHVLVDLKPQHIKKNNHGLELAVATAILIETKQIRLQSSSRKPWLIVGNISLKGEVTRAYESLDEFKNLLDYEVLAGPNTKMKCGHFEVENLRDLKCLRWIEPLEQEVSVTSTVNLPKLKFSKSASRLIEILAIGEHPCLLAGSVGSGKSTIAATTAKLLESPKEQDIEEIQKAQKYFRQNRQRKFVTRPEVVVHHSISTIAFLGGGSDLHPGEITRAHKGTLIMDEFMQFDSEIQDALREPLENAKLTVARKGQFIEFPADVFLMATTNLCPCGQYAMNSERACRCSQAKLKAYLSRLLGPCIDRFQILGFSSAWESQTKEIETVDLNDEIKKSIEYRIAFRKQVTPNSKLSNLELAESMDHKFINDYYKLEFLSERRQLALKRVARTIADLEKSERVRIQHFNEALSLSVAPFQWLEQAQKASARI